MDESTPRAEGQDAPTPGAPGGTPPRPRLVMAPTRRGPGGSWWIVLVLLVLAVVAALGVWSLAFREVGETGPSPSASPMAWAGAWARTDGLGGGLVIDVNFDAYRVTVYDAALQPDETVDAVARDDGRELRFTLTSPFAFGGLTGPLEAVLRAVDDPNAATLSVADRRNSKASLRLVRTPSLGQSSSTPSPPAPSPSPASGDDDRRIALRMIEAIERIQEGIEAWSRDNGGSYPLPADVRVGAAVGRYVDPWPKNPYAPDLLMAPGLEPGDFTYRVLDGGLGYTLTGYLENGAFVVP